MCPTFLGPISDSIGRKIPLFIGMTIFAIGSAGCAMSNTITHIVFWRIFQAFGACTGPMLARAMIRDLFSRTKAAQMLSTLMMIMAIAIMTAFVRAELGGMFIIVGMVFIYFSLNGIVAASATAAALDEVPHIAGSASALIGALQYGSGIISSLLLALFSKGTPWTMAWIMLVFTAASFLMVVVRERKLND